MRWRRKHIVWRICSINLMLWSSLITEHVSYARTSNTRGTGVWIWLNLWTAWAKIGRRTNQSLPLPELRMSGHSFLFAMSWWKLVSIYLGIAGRHPSLINRLKVSTGSTSIFWRCLSTMAFFTKRIPVLLLRTESNDVEHKMRAHLQWQFSRICVA